MVGDERRARAKYFRLVAAAVVGISHVVAEPHQNSDFLFVFFFVLRVRVRIYTLDFEPLKRTYSRSTYCMRRTPEIALNKVCDA